MKRVFYVALTSDSHHFEEIICYATKEQAKEGLKQMLATCREDVISMGYDDDMVESVNDDWFTIDYNEKACYYHAQIRGGVMFEEGEKPTPLKPYKVTITKTVLAYGEEDAIEVAKGDGDYEYDDEENATAEMVG